MPVSTQVQNYVKANNGVHVVCMTSQDGPNYPLHSRSENRAVVRHFLTGGFPSTYNLPPRMCLLSVDK